MSKRIFDFDDGDMIFGTGGDLGIDSDGHMMTRVSDNMSMDLETGDLHFTSRWNDEDEDN